MGASIPEYIYSTVRVVKQRDVAYWRQRAYSMHVHSLQHKACVAWHARDMCDCSGRPGCGLEDSEGRCC